MSRPGPDPLGADAVATVVRAEYGRVVAGLIRRFGDIGLAEDALGEALVVALERWPSDGVPPNPAWWLTTTASRKALDHLRRERVRDEKYAEAAMLTDSTPSGPTGPVTDDRLRLIFTCCHPALAVEARVALTLRMVGGLTVPEIARAFLVKQTTMEQRITRAKAKIKAAGIPYRMPSADDLPAAGGTPTTLLILMSYADYLAGQGVAHYADGTPLSVRNALALADQADLAWCVKSSKGAMLDLYRSRRIASPANHSRRSWSSRVRAYRR